MSNKPKLWSGSFILAFTANMLMFFSFYLLVPVLPFYLTKNLGQTQSVAGIVLSLYTLSALCIRPFSGYLVDSFARKPLYLLCYSIFTIIFAGYTIATVLLFFIVLRIMHGMAFGITSVSGNTLAIDIMPAERRGEGIGYFGMTGSLAMALGPMTGLFLYEIMSFKWIFLISFASSCLGFICATFIKRDKHTPQVEPDKKLSLDRFFLVKGRYLAISLFLFGVGYGVITNYIGVYSESIGMNGSAGRFFSILAVGVLLARFLSGKLINKGLYINIVLVGAFSLLAGYTAFIFARGMSFYACALLLGLGYGFVSPAFQTMLINLAEHNRRGTANSTYLTSWDIGIGLGIAIGGTIAQKLTFGVLYAICAVLILAGLILFIKIGAPYFKKHKLR